MKKLKRIIFAQVILSMLVCFSHNDLIASAASTDTSVSINVDGDLSISEGAVPYVASKEDIARDQEKLGKQTKSIGTRSVSSVLSVPVF